MCRCWPAPLHAAEGRREASDVVVQVEESLTANARHAYCSMWGWTRGGLTGCAAGVVFVLLALPIRIIRPHRIVTLLDCGQPVFCFSVSPRNEICGLHAIGKKDIARRHIRRIRVWFWEDGALVGKHWFRTIRCSGVERVTRIIGFEQTGRHGRLRIFRQRLETVS